MSWWPSFGRFKDTYLDVGYWAPSCEFWFQNRLKEIRSLKVQPMTQQQWAKKLWRLTTVRDFVDRNREAADGFLKGAILTAEPGVFLFPLVVLYYLCFYSKRRPVEEMSMIPSGPILFTSFSMQNYFFVYNSSQLNIFVYSV